MNIKPVNELSLATGQEPRFPSTRYQGSKVKLVKWIFENISDLKYESALDAFGGTGSIAYEFKKRKKLITYNDLLKFNYNFGTALIENSNTKLTDSDINWLLTRHQKIKYPSFIENTFRDIYFTDEENKWLDQTIANIYQLEDKYQFALAFFSLGQACIIKRPYNLFHRKNLYIRFANVERSFGNKTTWDKPFQDWFVYFCNEANNAVFDNGKNNKALNKDATEIDNRYDLIYIDTPYISKNGSAIDYRDFYHFLEGITQYKNWDEMVDYKSKHRKLLTRKNEWSNKSTIFDAFDRLFNNFKDSILVVSYRSDGIPTENELIKILKKYKSTVTNYHYGIYKYALSHNGDSKEMLLIGK